MTTNNSNDNDQTTIKFFVISENQVARVQKEWSALAGEHITVTATNTSDPIHAYGSELACLRLYKRFFGHCRVEYIERVGCYRFSTLGFGEKV